MHRSLSLALPFRPTVVRWLPPKKPFVDPSLNTSAAVPAAGKEVKTAPRKPAASGYNMYRRAQRGKFVGAGLSVKEINKAMASGWTELPSKQQAEYHALAKDADEDRRTLERIVRSMPDKPARNGFNLFKKERRPAPPASALKGLSGRAKIQAYSSAASDAWADLSKKDKQDFTDRVVKAKLEYNEALVTLRSFLPSREKELARKNGLNLDLLKFKGSLHGQRSPSTYMAFLDAFYKARPITRGLSKSESFEAVRERLREAGAAWQAQKLSHKDAAAADVELAEEPKRS